MNANFSGGGWGYHHYKYEIDLCQFFLTEKVTCFPILSAEAVLFICVYLLMLNNSGCIFFFKNCYLYNGYEFFWSKLRAWCCVSFLFSHIRNTGFSLLLCLSVCLSVCLWKMEIPISMAVKLVQCDNTPVVQHNVNRNETYHVMGPYANISTTLSPDRHWKQTKYNSNRLLPADTAVISNSLGSGFVMSSHTMLEHEIW
jgi:hypothetical protein